MADVKISDLTPAASATGAMQLEVNDSGASKSVTINQIQDKTIGTTNGLIARTGANETTARAIQAGNGIVVSNGDGVAGNPTIAADLNIATPADAVAGTGDGLMTADLTKQAIAAQAGGIRSVFELTTDWYTAPAVTGAMLTADMAKKILYVKEGFGGTGVNQLWIAGDTFFELPVGTEVPIVTNFGVTLEILPQSAQDFLRATPLLKVEPSSTGILRKVAANLWSFTTDSLQDASPVIVSVSTSDPLTSGGSFTVRPPLTALTGMMHIVLVETAAQMPTSAPSGYTVLPNLPQITGTAGATTATAIIGYYRIVDGTEALQSVTFSALDHAAKLDIVVANYDKDDPFNASAGAVLATASTAVSMPTLTTTAPKCLVMQAIAHATDTASPQFSGQSNAGLARLVEVEDFATTRGNGGGIALLSGIKKVAGSVAATTGTLATSSVQAKYTLAINPR